LAGKFSHDLPGWPRRLTGAMAAAYLGVDEEQLREWVAAGIYPPPRTDSGRELWDRHALDEAADKQPAPALVEARRPAGTTAPATLAQQARTRYVLVKKFVELTGYSQDAVYSKIHSGAWANGEQYVKAPDGRVTIDLEGYERWARSRSPAPPPVNRPEPVKPGWRRRRPTLSELLDD
jgi:hypothetical protein